MPIRPISFEEAKARYVHRYTMEHVPQWAKDQTLVVDGQVRYYAPHYRSDREWYENTTFPGENDIPKRAKYCNSHGETWPLGHSLVKPYQTGK